MVNRAVCVFLFRVVLPLSLIAAVVCRQNVLSIIYLFLLFAAPVVSNPSPRTVAGATGSYLKIVLAASILVAIAQIVFQVVLLSLQPYGRFLEKCSSLEKLLRHLGFQRYDHLSSIHVARLTGPEILMLVVSVVVYVCCSKYVQVSQSQFEVSSKEERGETPLCSEDHEKRSSSRRKISILSILGNVFMLTLLAVSGIVRPSVTSSVYFISFLATSTWVASKKPLQKKFAIFRVFLLIFAAVHLLVLYVYQMQIAQEILPPTTLYARLFGLTAIVNTSCGGDPRATTLNSVEWATYLNPAAIFALYCILVVETKRRLSSPSVSDLSQSFIGGGYRVRSMSLLYPCTAVTAITTFTTNTTTTTTTLSPYNTFAARNSLEPSMQQRLRRTRSEKPPSLHRRTKTSRKKYTAKRLLSAGDAERHYRSEESRSRRQGVEQIEFDATGSVIVSNGDTDVAPSEEVRRMHMIRFRTLLSPLTTVLTLISRQSYIATLIVMMAWSITYHSWLTFVLLLWSCILWMMPNSRKACLQSSPALVFYASVLLVIQYVYGMDLNNDELPQKIEGVNLQQIGLVKYPHLPCIPLAVKVLYTIMFWITMRQYMEEKTQELFKDSAEGLMLQILNKSQRGSVSLEGRQEQQQQQSSPLMKKFGDLILSILTKYWIWVVACMLMIISLQGGKVVIYRIMYMALFLFFILVFQLSYRFWRKMMYGFWLTVIIYSMLVLIMIYTYQFENFPKYWDKYLFVSEKLQRDIGLEIYDTGQLFLKLLQPTFFVVITIIQLHYFHKDFLRISDIEHGPTDVDPNVSSSNELTNKEAGAALQSEADIGPGSVNENVAIDDEVESPKQVSAGDLPVIVGVSSDEEKAAEELEKQQQQLPLVTTTSEPSKSWKTSAFCFLKECYRRGIIAFNVISGFIWRFLEIHMMKIVLFLILMLALYDVCLVHVVFAFLVTVALPCRRIQLFVLHCCAVWTSAMVLSKMIYQIDYIEEVWKVNCTESHLSNATVLYPFNETINSAHWIGFRKVSDLPVYLKGYIGLIILLSIEAVVRVREYYYQNLGKPQQKTGVIFQKITRAHADNGLFECFQYLVNYTFYKFGVEINFITMVAVIGIRLDIYAVIYAIWLGIMFSLKRTTLSRVWPFYVAVLAIFLPLEYCLCVGLPPGLCIDYPWSAYVNFEAPGTGNWNSGQLRELREWLFLPDFYKPLPAYKLAVDFFQLLFACCQLFVFHLESNPNADCYEGGSNKEIVHCTTPEPEENYNHDFVTYTKSYLDLVKVIVFSMFYWVTLAVIFLAGTNRVSLFAMGYVIGCFLFLWNGQEFYLKPLKTILRLWNTLLAYNIFVIFTKTILQLVGCVFLEQMLGNFCWAIQLFGIACLKKFEKGYVSVSKPGVACAVPEDEAGLLWDGICLAFLLLQRRFFCSHYFHHLVTEMHAQAKLASRGAELINQLLLKEVTEQEAMEKEVVEKIKLKMDRIRANQQKIKGKSYSEPQTHFEARRHSSWYSRHSQQRSYERDIGSPSPPLIRSLPVSQIVESQQLASAVAGPPSPESATCTFSLDSYLEPSLSFYRNSSNHFSHLLTHPPSNVGVCTPSEESFPLFPPPYPAVTSSVVPLQRPGTPHYNVSTHRRPFLLNLNHSRNHSTSFSSSFERHTQVAQPMSRSSSNQWPTSSVSPPPPGHITLLHAPSFRQSHLPPLANLSGISRGDSLRRSFTRRSSNPSSPTFSHHNSIRSGDYFMFEDLSDDGLAELEYGEKSKDDTKDSEVRGMSVSKLLASAMKSDIKHAVHEARQSHDGQSPETGQTSSGPTEASGRPPVSRTVSAISGTSSLPVGMSVSRQASLRSQGYTGDKPPEFISAMPTDDGRGISPPLQDLESALKVPGDERGRRGSQEADDVASMFLCEEKEKDEGLCTKLMNFLRFFWAFLEGIMVSCTVYLNAISKDYRYVARCLDKEKKLLKEKGIVSADSLREDNFNVSVSPSQHQPLILSRDEPLKITVERSSEDFEFESIECVDAPEEQDKFEKEQPVAVRLLISVWYALVSRSEIVCYFVIVINQIKSASLLSLPLPLMAFLWGTLSIPRPTKTFWITVITYTEAVVLAKYLFQFDFFPWNAGDPQVTKLNAPFWPPRIIGIEKKEKYADYDLFLLLVVFFHRYILKSLGLWKDDNDSSNDSSDSEKDDKSQEVPAESPSHTEKAIDTEDVNYDECDSEEYVKSYGIGDLIMQYVHPFQHFFRNLFHPLYRVTVDVYAFMFVFDFITFLILVFGYWAFGPGAGSEGDDGGVASYFEENKVPIPFLVMLIAQFGLIIIDRALFLRKCILGKVIFQVFMVFIVHLWMFFVLPAVSEREFNRSVPPQLWYFVKCIYLLLSAYQIRSGYPTRILGNFLTKKYNYINMFAFRGFMAVPFLFELRALMDWIWTDTSMSLSSWLKMEDIFANIFLLKCQRRAETEYPTPRGEKRQPVIKYGMGGTLLFIIIFIIWFPLVLFALGNTVGTANPPTDVTIEITFGGYEPLFKMSAQHSALKSMTKAEYDNLILWYGTSRAAQTFLQNFDESDIVLAELNVNSTAVWGISPPSQQQLMTDLMAGNLLTLKLAWQVSRVTINPADAPTVSDELSVVLKEDDPTRMEFAMMLNRSLDDGSVLVPNLFPKFIRVRSRGKASYIPQLMKDSDTDQVVFTNLLMSLRSGSFMNISGQQEWWEAREDCATSPFQGSPFPKDCKYLRLYTVNDKAFPATFSMFSGYGIVGMYTTLVLLISRFIRGMVAGVSYHIMFDDMPYVDRLLQLCLDIYLVRESGEMHLEEDLFAKLIFLYRSPETLIKWTRYPRSSGSP